MNTQLKNILDNESIILVVINNDVCESSTPDQIKFATLNGHNGEGWKTNVKNAINADYIIGSKAGIAYSLYKISSIEIIKPNGKTLFKTCEDLSHLIKGFDLKTNGYRQGHKEIQYINCKLVGK